MKQTPLLYVYIIVSVYYDCFKLYVFNTVLKGVCSVL